MSLFDFFKRTKHERPPPDTRPKRDWKSLPSVTMLEVTPWVAGSTITDAAKQATTELLCVGYGPPPATDAAVRRQIDLSFHFSDDPRLAILMLHFNHCILIRRTFLVQHEAQLAPAQGFNDSTERMNQVGKAGNYHCGVLME